MADKKIQITLPSKENNTNTSTATNSVSTPVLEPKENKKRGIASPKERKLSIPALSKSSKEDDRVGGGLNVPTMGVGVGENPFQTSANSSVASVDTEAANIPRPKYEPFQAGGRARTEKSENPAAATNKATASPQPNLSTSPQDAISKLATDTIVKVHRMELDMDGVKRSTVEHEHKIQTVVDYVNALALQVEMLNAQNMALAWQNRLMEYTIAGLKGWKVNSDEEMRVKVEMQKWQQEASVKQAQAQEAFSHIQP